jgi:GTP-binding protein
MVRKRKIEDKTVYFAILRTLEALKKSEIVILLLDAATGVVTFDKYLGGLLNDFLKGVLIAVNKWDLLTRGKVFRVEKAPLNKKEEELAMAYWLYYLQKELPHLSFAPVVFISALEKLNLNFLLEQILRVSENRPRLLSEEELLSLNENLHKQHSHLPLDLIVQQDLENPQIFLALSKAKITTSQKRFLSNFLIKNLNFPGWPLQIILGKPSRLRT